MINSLKFSKVQVTDRVLVNRERHRSVYEQAMELYRKQAIDMLNKYIYELKNGKGARIIVDLPIPEDHTGDYDVVLDMLNSCLDTEIELNQTDYRCYVRDEWEWKRKFLGTVNSYMVDYVET